MAPVGRIGERRTFEAFRLAGRRSRVGPIAVTRLDEPGSSGPRVAYAIGRPVGPAVIRNRLRRRLRAVVSELAPELAPGAYLVGASVGASALSAVELRTTLRTAVERLAAASGPRPGATS